MHIFMGGLSLIFFIVSAISFKRNNGKTFHLLDWETVEDCVADEPYMRLSELESDNVSTAATFAKLSFALTCLVPVL